MVQKRWEMFEIEYYQQSDGSMPVKEFINGLEPKMRSKAFAAIFLLSEEGNALREPFSKSIGNGLFELRIKFASDITRIFYFFRVNNKIVLTNGFIKKTNRTPPREIELARKYKADYEGRHCNG